MCTPISTVPSPMSRTCSASSRSRAVVGSMVKMRWPVKSRRLARSSAGISHAVSAASPSSSSHDPAHAAAPSAAPSPAAAAPLSPLRNGSRHASTSGPNSPWFTPFSSSSACDSASTVPASPNEVVMWARGEMLNTLHSPMSAKYSVSLVANGLASTSSGQSRRSTLSSGRRLSDGMNSMNCRCGGTAIPSRSPLGGWNTPTARRGCRLSVRNTTRARGRRLSSSARCASRASACLYAGDARDSTLRAGETMESVTAIGGGVGGAAAVAASAGAAATAAAASVTSRVRCATKLKRGFHSATISSRAAPFASAVSVAAASLASSTAPPSRLSPAIASANVGAAGAELISASMPASTTLGSQLVAPSAYLSTQSFSGSTCRTTSSVGSARF
mmetsp:Transcript_20929/g.67335  ORF Transcript_20929/g.67335 Transcript_20929/m.67335 type:complete len:389 (+) Transcript_20929:2006-3172(+)